MIIISYKRILPVQCLPENCRDLTSRCLHYNPAIFVQFQSDRNPGTAIAANLMAGKKDTGFFIRKKGIAAHTNILQQFFEFRL
jgi:hypothetical protein